MPSSDYRVINAVMPLYMASNPSTVLDIGVGFGKWGHLFREYGDIFRGRLERDEWQTIIHGVEIFDKYINDAQRAHYDKIIIADISKISGTLPNYDFIYAGDVIEHLPKQVAKRVISDLQRKARRLVLSIPLGLDWPQGEVFGNDAEAHLSTWTVNDFEGWHYSEVKTDKGKTIGVFAIC